MSWTHSSRAVALGVLLAISLMAVGTAAAITTTGDAPEPANVNDSVTMNATIEDPFENQPDQWTLRGTTELENASWTIEVYEQGQLVSQSGSQESIEQALDRSGDTTPDRIEISVSGSVPPLEEFDYQDRSVENYSVMSLSNADTGDEFESWSAHRYTDGSNEARSEIDDAQAAIDEVDDPSDDLQNELDQAISAYNNGNFENAISLAQDAQATAEEEQQEQESGLPLPLIAGGAVVLLLIIGGALYYRQSQQQDNYKLQ
ncbi:hypothetical protein [Salinibaculum salinum]|uniref:hypothetical protein n=1 Tax=Salinibaculum salinum TaxID=3131996 RepID=UPI0030EEC58D